MLEISNNVLAVEICEVHTIEYAKFSFREEYYTSVNQLDNEKCLDKDVCLMLLAVSRGPPRWLWNRKRNVDVWKADSLKVEEPAHATAKGGDGHIRGGSLLRKR